MLSVQWIILSVLLRIIIYLALAAVIFPVFLFFIYVHPHRYVTDVSPSDYGMKYEEITLLTSDGVRLSGWFIPNENSAAAIIVCHGYPADKGDVLILGKFLRPHYNLLFFDFRAMGRSQGWMTTFGYRETRDFNTAVDFLKKRGISRIGAFGFSMGGAVAMMANNPDVAAIVSESSFADLDSMIHVVFQNFGPLRVPFVFVTKFLAGILLHLPVEEVSPANAIANTKAAVFIIHSELDSQIPDEHAFRLHSAKPESQIWVVPDTDHGGTYSGREAEYESRILKFFSRHL
jgi:pimeloyl-ACP methyl ester carboxylesterase